MSEGHLCKEDKILQEKEKYSPSLVNSSCEGVFSSLPLRKGVTVSER